MKQTISKVKVGDILLTDAVNKDGIFLMKKGAVLGDASIQFLKDKGMLFIDIEDTQTKEDLLKAALDKKPDYNLSDEMKNNAVDKESVFYESFHDGMEAIRNVDVDSSIEISKDICDKVLGSDDIQSEIALLKSSCDSVLSHSMNVAIMMASMIVWEEGASNELCYETVAGAMLHDIGKLYIPKEVLDKPGKLTPDEYMIMKQHAELGYTKLSRLSNVPARVSDMAYQHHENADGSGYPRGLKGDEITIESKILHVADVYEAMTAERCYKKPVLPGDATEYTMANFGHMFDENTVRKFLRIVPAYRRGDMVMLSNGQLAEVLSSNGYNSLRPKIKILQTGQVIDLYTNPDTFNIVITSMVNRKNSVN